MSGLLAQAEELNLKVDRLTMDVARLRHAVSRLAERIGPEIQDPHAGDLPRSTKPPRTFVDMFAILKTASRSIFEIEGWVGQIGARIDVIENDVVSREEMKAHFKPRPPSKKDGPRRAR